MTDINAPVPESSADQLQRLAEFDFDAMLTDEQMMEIEAQQELTWGMKRRMTLAVLSRSKAQLLEGFGGVDDAEILLEMIDHAADYRDYLKACVEDANAAFLRLVSVAQSRINLRSQQREGES